MKRTHKQLIEGLMLLNENQSIAETSQEIGVSRQTLYNLYKKDSKSKRWEFKPEYLAQWFEIYAAYKILLQLVQNQDEFKCSLPTLVFLEDIQLKIEEFNEIEISLL